jgi:NADH-quinone oxidoreductase subunit J
MSIFAATEVLVAQNIAFGIIALGIIVGAVRLVTTNNVVHAALWLVVVLGGIAALYILLAAEFTAIVQVLVYIGAIVVLFLFGIMLTRAKLGGEDMVNKKMRPAAIVIAVALFALMAYSLWDYFGDTGFDVMGRSTAELGQTTAQVSDSLFLTYLVPFEVVSVLLLAALTGAIVLARRD